jgi:hypothetical protein
MAARAPASLPAAQSWAAASISLVMVVIDRLVDVAGLQIVVHDGAVAVDRAGAAGAVGHAEGRRRDVGRAAPGPAALQALLGADWLQAARASGTSRAAQWIRRMETSRLEGQRSTFGDSDPAVNSGQGRWRAGITVT